MSHRGIVTENVGDGEVMERIPRFPHKIQLTQPSFTIPCGNRTQRRYVFNYLFLILPHRTKKDPVEGNYRVLSGVISERCPSVISDEHVS